MIRHVYFTHLPNCKHLLNGYLTDMCIHTPSLKRTWGLVAKSKLYGMIWLETYLLKLASSLKLHHFWDSLEPPFMKWDTQRLHQAEHASPKMKTPGISYPSEGMHSQPPSGTSQLPSVWRLDVQSVVSPGIVRTWVLSNEELNEFWVNVFGNPALYLVPFGKQIVSPFWFVLGLIRW